VFTLHIIQVLSFLLYLFFKNMACFSRSVIMTYKSQPRTKFNFTCGFMILSMYTMAYNDRSYDI
jgi:hypothetical protein